MSDIPQYITIARACEIIGGEKPISPATFYRGVRAGIYHVEHPSPGIARVRLGTLIATLNREAS